MLMKELKEEQWDNHARSLQALMVEFSVKRRLNVSWMEEWLGTFQEAGRKLGDLRDLANILLDYQNKNHITHSDMNSLMDWLFEEAMLFNIENSKRENK